MNWKSTLALVLLAGGAGAWYFLGDAVVRPPEPEKSAAIVALDALSPATITRVEVAYPTGNPLVIDRADTDTGWKMPGNWPLRKPEVGELVGTLGTLRSRFQPIALPENADLAPYGLAADQKPIVVKLMANGAPLTLAFGEPALSEGETAFTRPAYVRVNDSREVLKLGPDVMPVVRRSAESYRRRQLFTETERVKIAGGGAPPTPFGPPPSDAPATVALPGANTLEITVSRPAPKFFSFDLSPVVNFTLARTGALPEPGILTKGAEPALRPDRLADAWEVRSPIPASAEPTRLRSALAAVAELWVDRFVPASEASFALNSRYGIAQIMPIPFEPPLALAVRAYPEAAFLDPLRSKVPLEERAGFSADNPGVRVTLSGDKQEPVQVRFGGIAKVTEREESITLPGGPPGAPPQNITRKVPVEFRYARLDGNPQVFVVSAEKFVDLFAVPADLLDPQVARFEPEEVDRVFIATPNGPAGIDLQRTRGNPKAKTDEGKVDRWTILANTGNVPADIGKVNDLVNRLAGLRADSPDRRRERRPGDGDVVYVTVYARERRAEGEPDAPQRTYGMTISSPDPVRHLLPVIVGKDKRVMLVENRLGPDDPDSWLGDWLFPETLSGELRRSALAYRGRKLMDTADRSLESVAVENGFTIKQEPAGWKLTAPISSDADPEKAGQLALSLVNLHATEYLTMWPTDEQLKSFGLEKPAQTISLAFTGGRKYTLELGAPRPGKPEVFARLDKGTVFGLPKSVPEQLTTGAVGLLPLKVWAAAPEKITGVQITRSADAAKDSFALTKDDAAWTLTGPFTAPIPDANAKRILSAVANLTATKYESLSAADASKYGLDKPFASVKVTYTETKPGAMGETPATGTVAIGGLTPDGFSRYARLDIPNAPVFVVAPDFIAAAQTPPLELPDRALLALAPAQVVKVRVATGKPEDAFTLTKDATGKWTAEGTTFGVDAERIFDLASTAARPPVSRLAAYGEAIRWADYGLENPETTITVTTDGAKPETHTIALGNPDPTGSRFARIDNKPAVALLAGTTADMLTRKKFDYADRALLSFDPATVVGFTRTRGKEELELAPGAAIGWDVLKPTKQKADGEFVDGLAAALGRLRAERVAGYGKKADVFKQYALEPPVAAVTVTVGDRAEQKTLRIGGPVDAAKPDGDRYAAVETTAPEVIVGVLPAALAKKLLAPPVAFRDRTLARFVDADKVVLERGGRKVTFAKVGVTWKVTEPLTADAETGELELFVADLGRLRAESWVAEKPAGLKPFGLDKPEAKWTLSFEDRPVLVLLVGAKTTDGRVHVMTEKGDAVGLLDPRTTDRVLAEYRQRRPWTVDAAQAEAVDLSIGGSKFTLEKAGPGWVDAAKPGDAIDVRVVNELVGTLGALRVERYAADKDADLKLFGLEKPEATIAITSRGAPPRTLEIGGVVGGTDGKQRYARVADKARTDVFVLTAADTERLMRDRAMYVMKK